MPVRQKQHEFKGDFEAAMKAFVKHTENSKDFARICAQMSISHFSQHGDLSYCQRFLEAMPQNYVRRNAYLAWLAAHAPVVMEKGKLLKNTSVEAIKLPLTEEQLGEAYAVDFWDFAPETQILEFTALDFDKALLRLINNYRNSKTKVAADKTTLDHIDDMEEVIKTRIDVSLVGNSNAPAQAQAVH